MGKKVHQQIRHVVGNVCHKGEIRTHTGLTWSVLGWLIRGKALEGRMKSMLSVTK